MNSTIRESPRATTTGDETRLRRGSDAHKRLFCHTLLDTHDPYKPAVIDWPQLEPDARERLVQLPIWDVAVQTEGRARLNVASYAAKTPRTCASAATIN